MQHNAKDNLTNGPANSLSRLSRLGKSGARRRMIIGSAAVLIVAAVCCVVAVFAWYASNNSSEVSVSVQDFSVTPNVWNDGAWIPVADSDDVGTPTRFSFDPFAQDPSLRISLTANGMGSAYVRVRVVESFYDSANNLIPGSKISVSYTYDNTVWAKSGDYYYYNGPVTGTTESNLTTTIPFITDVTAASVPAGQGTPNTVRCSVSLIVEAVQPDRAVEFFGIDPDSLFS